MNKHQATIIYKLAKKDAIYCEIREEPKHKTYFMEWEVLTPRYWIACVEGWDYKDFVEALAVVSSEVVLKGAGFGL